MTSRDKVGRRNMRHLHPYPHHSAGSRPITGRSLKVPHLFQPRLSVCEQPRFLDYCRFAAIALIVGSRPVAGLQSIVGSRPLLGLCLGECKGEVALNGHGAVDVALKYGVQGLDSRV